MPRLPRLLLLLLGLSGLPVVSCAGPRSNEVGGGAGAPPGMGGSGGFDIVFPPTTTTTGSGGAGFSFTGPDPVVSISPDSAYETESSVQWNDVGPFEAVTVAWTAVAAKGGSFIGYAFSHDGGQSFFPPSRLDAPGGGDARSPSLVRSGDGSLYLTFLGAAPSGGSHVYVAKALAGDTSFGTPVEASDPIDATATCTTPELVLTDPVVLTYAFAGKAGRGLVAARSQDGGATWTRSVIVADPSSTVAYERPHPTHDPWNGVLYLAHLERDTGTGATRVVLRWSADLGTTWAPTDTAVVSQPGEPVANTAPNIVPAVLSTTPPKYPVWVSYGVSNDPLAADGSSAQKLFDIRIARSIDAGHTFAAPKSLLFQGSGLYALSPRFVADQTGAMNLVYYEGKGNQDGSGSVRWARDTSFNTVLLKPLVIAQPILFLASRVDPRWLGDSCGVAGGKDRFYASYVDNTSGVSHVAVHRQAIPPP